MLRYHFSKLGFTVRNVHSHIILIKNESGNADNILLSGDILYTKEKLSDFSSCERNERKHKLTPFSSMSTSRNATVLLNSLLKFSIADLIIVQ